MEFVRSQVWTSEALSAAAARSCGRPHRLKRCGDTMVTRIASSAWRAQSRVKAALACEAKRARVWGLARAVFWIAGSSLGAAAAVPRRLIATGCTKWLPLLVVVFPPRLPLLVVVFPPRSFVAAPTPQIFALVGRVALSFICVPSPPVSFDRSRSNMFACLIIFLCVFKRPAAGCGHVGGSHLHQY